MPTLEAPTAFTQDDERLFYDLLRVADLSAHAHGVQPLGAYASPELPARHEAPLDQPPTPAPTYRGAVGRAAVPDTPPPLVPTPAPAAGDDLYFGSRRPQRFDDVPAGPLLIYRSGRPLPVGHRFSERRPRSHDARHRSPDRSWLARTTSRTLGYLATATVTTGALLLWPAGTAH